MYVGQPFEEIAANLPAIQKNNFQSTPNKATPQKTCGVACLEDAPGSNERPNWLPRLDSNQDKQVQWLAWYHYTTGQIFLPKPIENSSVARSADPHDRRGVPQARACGLPLHNGAKSVIFFKK